MMKNILIAVFCFVAINVYAEKKDPNKVIEEVTFSVPIDCQGCVDKVNKNMAYEKGVKGIECNLEKQTVKIIYRNDKTNIENLKKGFAKIGYDNVKVVPTSCDKEKTKSDKCCDHKH